ncbi:tetratricopeptide repeat protein [Candidatus Poribacteria bacterium]|nr:tetratricopeptide repeat protein [Candidatus Poribacteria bacterium]MYG05725.1 tetratricopeptide repeat protein [Candidatus Poribacteria bacterium]MYK22406.1 tetratricopeptide repeat protein [Candidatus Poribacteria bacterium]
MTSNENQVSEQESTEEQTPEQTPANKAFRIVCMTFCLAVTLLFIWVWHHQTQFNDHYRKAAFLMRNGDAQQAIEAYQKAIKNKRRTLFFTQEPSAYNNLGQAHLYAEEYAPAIENFKKVIEMAPDIAEGHVNLTTAYLRQNLAAEAREACLRALETFPQTALLHYNLACAYALEDKSQKAVDSLIQAVNLNPDLESLAQEENALKGIVSQLP